MLDNRAYMYAFLSMVFTENLSKRAIDELKNNLDFLNIIGKEAKEYMLSKTTHEIEEELNIDFTSAFVVNSHPIEAAVTDAKVRIASGLENPVVLFYTKYGYELNLNQTHLAAPDHISIELGFMQALVYRGEKEAQIEFMNGHIITWMPIFLVGAKALVDTPFYKNFLDFALEFIMSDYEYLSKL
jgi:putative dimethyl sulfoxide reductase chaperone